MRKRLLVSGVSVSESKVEVSQLRHCTPFEKKDPVSRAGGDEEVGELPLRGRQSKERQWPGARVEIQLRG